MHRILLDVTRLNTRKNASTPSGIDRVDLRYVEHFPARSTEYVLSWLGCLFLVRKPPFERLVRGLKQKWSRGESCHRLPSLLALVQSNPFEFARVTARNLLPSHWGLKQHYSAGFLRFMRETSEPWLYVNTSHAQIRSLDALAGLRDHADIRSLYYVHDLIPITHREYVRPAGAQHHNMRLEQIRQVGANVICNSEYTQQTLNEWIEQQGGRPTSLNSTVIPIGVEPDLMEKKSSPTQRPLNERYFLMLGTIEPRKNHLLALNVWRRMVEEKRPDIPKLVIIGKRGWENENIIDMLERCDAIQPYVIEKHNVSDDDLALWLEHCAAMIYPSFVEGWGMPVAEALAMSVPVICSDIPPFQEAGQGLASYIDPLDGTALMDLVLSESIDRPKGYLAPTWERHFEQLEALINSTMSA